MNATNDTSTLIRVQVDPSEFSRSWVKANYEASYGNGLYGHPGAIEAFIACVYGCKQ